MKNFWTKLCANKKLLWGCVAGIVCICLVIGVILLGGGSGAPGGASTGDVQLGGTTQDTAQKPTQGDTEPESTGAGESNPSEESTAPVEPTDPTETVEPTDPSETTPPETEPVTEPSTEPETEPEDTWIPTEDPNAKPTEGETFDFGNATPDNLTYEEWSTWSWEKQNAFMGTNGYKGGMKNWTVEEKHKFRCMKNNNYDCGYEGHWCVNDLDHAYAMAQIKKGCEHCGKHDCPSLFSHNKDGHWDYDHTLCPEYDVKEDEGMYCKKCGLPTPMSAKVGEECCQHAIIADYVCTYCGETIHYGEHHHCIKKH